MCCNVCVFLVIDKHQLIIFNQKYVLCSSPAISYDAQIINLS